MNPRKNPAASYGISRIQESGEEGLDSGSWIRETEC